MAIIWTPLPVEPLIEAQEDQANISATVLASSDDPADPVLSLAWSSAEPMPPQVRITIAADLFTIEVPHFLGLFPIQDIAYLRHGQVGHCNAWAELPADAEELLAYRPDPSSFKDFALTVTATQQSGTDTPADYVLRVYANFDLGKLALQEAVNARR